MAVPVVLLPLAAVLGVAVGSSLGAVVRRLPSGETLAPAVERRHRDARAGTGAGFVVMTAVVGTSWALPAVLYLTAAAVALALIDLDLHRLPDAIVLPSYPVLAVLLALASWNPGGGPDWGALLRAGAGGGGLLAFYLVAASLSPTGMGLGDVKLSGLLGMVLAWFGWGQLAVGASAAFLLGGLFSVALLLAGRARRTSGIPFGPWMLLGASAGIAVGQPVAGWYLGLLG